MRTTRTLTRRAAAVALAGALALGAAACGDDDGGTDELTEPADTGTEMSPAETGTEEMSPAETGTEEMSPAETES